MLIVGTGVLNAEPMGTATITSPAANARLTGNAQVSGTANVQNFQFYKLEFAMANAGWALIGDLIDPEAGVPEDGHGLLELPLYDLMGNILGKPVYALMGAAGPRDVPIYCGSVYFEDLESPKGIDYLLECCRQAYDTGYRAFKLKMGRGFTVMPHNEGLQRDIDVVRAVRKRFPDCRILVDANNGFTVADACRFVAETVECDLYWIEEPFLEERDGLLRLREQMEKVGCKALIAEGEGSTERPPAPGRYGGYSQKQIDFLYALAAEKLVHVFVMDLGTTGYTRWRRIMPELKKAGVLASPHLWMWTPRPYYAAHLAGGVGNVCIVEGIPGKPDGADFSAYTFVDGKLRLPDAPGFGLRLA
jgi:L-alanine-DL-glutamate epimerase-like enolase superfamily enzyme